MTTSHVLTRLLLRSLLHSHRVARWPTKRQQIIRQDARRHRGRWTRAGWQRDMSIRTLYLRQRGICALCHQPVAWHDKSLDHIRPLALGGRHEPSNVHMTHLICNLRKGARFIG